MSDSSQWLLSKALDFWEIIILKSAPTLHLIYYAMLETLFFIRFGSFSMFIEWYCIKRLFLQHYVVFLLFYVATVISEPFFAGAYFRPDFAESDGKSLRLDIFGLKRNWSKRNSFLNSIR